MPIPTYTYDQQLHARARAILDAAAAIPRYADGARFQHPDAALAQELALTADFLGGNLQTPDDQPDSLERMQHNAAIRADRKRVLDAADRLLFYARLHPVADQWPNIIIPTDGP